VEVINQSFESLLFFTGSCVKIQKLSLAKSKKRVKSEWIDLSES